MENNYSSSFNFKLWEPDAQPDILGKAESFGNIEWDYEAFIEIFTSRLERSTRDILQGDQ